MTDAPKGDQKPKPIHLTKRAASGTTSHVTSSTTSPVTSATTAPVTVSTSANEGLSAWSQSLKIGDFLVGRGNSNYFVITPQTELLRQKEDLEAQLRSTRDSAFQLQKEIAEKSKNETELKLAKADLESKIVEYVRLERLRFLVDRILPQAIDHPGILDLFPLDKMCMAFVMSVDIRRSTDLMLKARHPRQFAEFITALSRQLRETVINNYGVFDKFTGDGILAFFPIQYSGDDAGLWMLQAAKECHEAFQKLYRDNRKCFNAVPVDTGLGIGVDFGEVQLVQIGGDLTVVGTPVVYACRMGSAPPNTTFINEPAYDVVFDKYSAYCQFEETQANFKNDGIFLAHEARLNGKSCQPRLPAWTESPPPPEEATGESINS